MVVAAVKCGCIDPSASNLGLLIKPTIHRCTSSIQGVFVVLLVLWTEDMTYGRCGRTKRCGRNCWCNRAEPWPGVADSGQLRSATVRLRLVMCGQTWPGAAGFAPLLWRSPLRFICSL
jgi:hypothetical protein